MRRALLVGLPPILVLLVEVGPVSATGSSGASMGAVAAAGYPRAPLVSAGERGAVQMGFAVAISADGRTALVSSLAANNDRGAVYVFLRAGGRWVVQARLALPGTRGFGERVALSADGDTALIGASVTDGGRGGAWVFVRSGSRWREQARLRPAGEGGSAYFGEYVALSADGQDAFMAGPDDDYLPGTGLGQGAVWVFVHKRGVWRQAGAKLVAPKETVGGGFGYAIAVSANGDNLVIGAPFENNKAGAAWFAARKGGVWRVVQGPVTGPGETGAGEFGYATAISGNGKVAMISALADSTTPGVKLGGRGATWTFVHTRDGWKQQGRKLQSPKPTLYGSFGTSISLSGNGHTALVGAATENHVTGDAWIFKHTGSGWTPCRPALLPPASAGPRTDFGYSTALTPAGTLALVGAPRTHHSHGAAWAFTLQSPAC